MIGKKRNKNRERATRHMLLFNDYFTHEPANDDRDFHRHFRMQRSMFMNIVHCVRDYNDYFELNID